MDVAVSRLVYAPPETLASALTPATVLEFEGWTTSELVERDGDRAVVEANPGGRLLAPQFVFERDENRITYRQADRRLVRVESTIEWAPAASDGKTEVTARAHVEPSLPVPLLADLVAWKRRRDLRRVLDRVETAVA